MISASEFLEKFDEADSAAYESLCTQISHDIETILNYSCKAGYGTYTPKDFSVPCSECVSSWNVYPHEGTVAIQLCFWDRSSYRGKLQEVWKEHISRSLQAKGYMVSPDLEVGAVKKGIIFLSRRINA